MRQFTNKEKLTICETALKWMERAELKKVHDGLCHFINGGIIEYTEKNNINRMDFIDNPDGIMPSSLGYYMEIYIPELARYNPRLKDPRIAEDTVWLNYWFPLGEEGTKKRKRILKRVIKQLKKKINEKTI